MSNVEPLPASVTLGASAVGTDQQGTLWRSPNFLLLFFSAALLNLGNRFYELAIPLALYKLTRSATVMGTMRAVEFLPNVLLAIFIGALVDRTYKKKLLRRTLLLQSLALAGLALVAWRIPQQPLAWYVLGFVYMLTGYTYDMTRGSVIKLTVPRAQLTNANAHFAGLGTAVSMLGPILAAWFMETMTLSHALGVTAMFTIGGWLLHSKLKFNESILEPQEHALSLGVQLQQGWAALRENRTLWTLSWVVFVVNFLTALAEGVMVFNLKDRIAMSDRQIGVCFALTGAGSFLATLCISWLRHHCSLSSLALASLMATAFAYLSLGTTTNYWLVCIAFLLTGLTSTLLAISVWTFRQETTSAHLLGRVSGITGCLFKIGVPLGLVMSSSAASLVGATNLLLTSAAVALLLFGYMLIVKPLKRQA